MELVKTDLFPSAITWCAGKVEVLRLDPNGKFFVYGKEVAEDKEVYTAFKNWLNIAQGDGYICTHCGKKNNNSVKETHNNGPQNIP
jgi:hypothetical protein